MSFATPVFIWFFLPAVLLAYWALPARWRNAILAVASLIFYAWGGGPFVLLLAGCIAGNYTAGLFVGPGSGHPPRLRRMVMLGCVVADLGVLGIWKYAGFASRQIDTLERALGGHGTAVVHLTLPIGISFFTFHHLSYVVDVYRGSRPPLRHPVTFITYIAMFPQLVAGPIVRYHEISEQLVAVPKDKIDDFAAGFPRFALGLAKKVVVADAIAPVASAVFDSSGGDLTTRTAWLGALAYTLQIYFDFSGYSDMAIGLGRMFGFRLPENFDRPYTSVSVTDFWRRWHMSLSRWFRDYLYIPLGGNRHGKLIMYRNLWVVFILCGFWHGANWTFLVWGVYHGGLQVIEKATGLTRLADDRLVVLRRAATFLLVLVGWVFFRAKDMSTAWHVLGRMFVWHGGPTGAAVTTALTHQRTFVLVLAALAVLMPRRPSFGRVLEDGKGVRVRVAQAGVAMIVAPYAAMLVAAGTFSPFLYYQF